MITFTESEVIEMLKHISRIEGFVMSLKERGSVEIWEQFEYPVELLTNKINELDK
jgi:hypothetical protein